MGVLAGQKGGTRNLMGNEEKEQVNNVFAQGAQAIEKPEQYQKKWTELGFCWAEQEILIFTSTYHALSIGFLPQLAGRH